MQVLYESKPIDDARLVVLKIWNSGKAPISSNDYERPLTFDFGEHAEVLDATVIETLPTNIIEDAVLEKSLNKVILQPLLLNRNDSIKLKVLLTKFVEQIQASARISGVTKILPPEEFPLRKRIRTSEGLLKFSAYLAAVSTILLIIMFLSINNVFNIKTNNGNSSLLFSNQLPYWQNLILTNIIEGLTLSCLFSIVLILISAVILLTSKYLERKRYKD